MEKKSEMTKEIRKLLEDIAAITARTYAARGDNELIGESEAIERILVMLKRFDPTIIDRCSRRRLPKVF